MRQSLFGEQSIPRTCATSVGQWASIAAEPTWKKDGLLCAVGWQRADLNTLLACLHNERDGLTLASGGQKHLRVRQGVVLCETGCGDV
jgi:hypothetical protein